MTQSPHDIAVEAVKAAPPVAVTGSIMAGMSPADWITVLTIIYLALQIGLLIPKYWDRFTEWRHGR
jgi:hypothetical protein